jgi:hypothetical protein
MMAKAIFEFDILDPDDKSLYDDFVKGRDMSCFISTFEEHMRGRAKYGELTIEQESFLDDIRDTWYDLKEQYGIDND